jgi:hypothetical protein
MIVGVGTKLYGFCNGYFGRDSYDEKIIEAIGNDWVVVRDSNNIPIMAYFENESVGTIYEILEQWTEEN